MTGVGTLNPETHPLQCPVPSAAVTSSIPPILALLVLKEEWGSGCKYRDNCGGFLQMRVSIWGISTVRNIVYWVYIGPLLCMGTTLYWFIWGMKTLNPKPPPHIPMLKMAIQCPTPSPRRESCSIKATSEP